MTPLSPVLALAYLHVTTCDKQDRIVLGRSCFTDRTLAYLASAVGGHRKFTYAEDS